MDIKDEDAKSFITNVFVVVGDPQNLIAKPLNKPHCRMCKCKIDVGINFEQHVKISQHNVKFLLKFCSSKCMHKYCYVQIPMVNKPTLPILCKPLLKDIISKNFIVGGVPSVKN